MATQTANKSTAKATNKTTSKTATKTAKSTSTKQPTPRLYEREPRVVLQDTAYATAALASDAVDLVRTLPDRARELRERTRKDLDGRLNRLEKELDKKAKAGRRVTRDVRKQEQVSKVLDQATTTRSQVKAAFTSIRKTAESAVGAARDQADNAKVQVKAAATSAQKTAGTVVEAGREVAS